MQIFGQKKTNRKLEGSQAEMKWDARDEVARILKFDLFMLSESEDCKMVNV